MPPTAEKLLNWTIAGTLAAFIVALALCYLFMRLGDEIAVTGAARGAYVFAGMLIVALACDFLCETRGSGQTK